MAEIDNIIAAVAAAYREFKQSAIVDRETATAVGNAVRFLAADLESAKGLLGQAER